MSTALSTDIAVEAERRSNSQEIRLNGKAPSISTLMTRRTRVASREPGGETGDQGYPAASRSHTAGAAVTLADSVTPRGVPSALFTRSQPISQAGRYPG